MNSVFLRTLGISRPLLWPPSLSRCFSLSHPHHVSKAQYDLLRLDPKALRDYIDRSRHAHDLRYHSDPVFRAKKLNTAKAWRDKYKQGQRYRFSQLLRHWIRRLPWFRDELPWKTYRPVCYDRSTEHYCTGCAWTRRGGNRVWWKSTDNDSYLCHACRIPLNPDWNDIMPEGYADIKCLKDLKARKEQLEAEAHSTKDS